MKRIALATVVLALTASLGTLAFGVSLTDGCYLCETRHYPSTIGYDAYCKSPDEGWGYSACEDTGIGIDSCYLQGDACYAITVGGGGGAGGCQVQPGEFCPASCMQCTSY